MTSHFKSTPDDRYFEDYVPGAVHEFGSIAVDEKEVIEFGKRYVPLSYHVDKVPPASLASRKTLGLQDGMHRL